MIQYNSFDEVTSINFQNTDHTLVDDLRLGDHKQLGDLTLINMGLSKIPQEIYDLPKLYSLNLTSNNISYVDSNIVKMSKLTVLHLSNNPICELPVEITQLPLHDLHISNTNIEKIPTSFPMLETIDLRYTKINSENIVNLIKNSPELMTVIICQYQVDSILQQYQDKLFIED